jgi:hypothetical protein
MKVNNELMLQNEMNSLGGENIKQTKGITSADMILRRRWIFCWAGCSHWAQCSALLSITIYLRSTYRRVARY